MQLEKINDSLNDVFFVNKQALIDLRKYIATLDGELDQKRIEVRELRDKIGVIKGEMTETGDNPDQFVSENELGVITSLVTQTVYQNEAEKVVDTLEYVSVEALPDISRKKMKIRNEMIRVKIDEYKRANSQMALIILRQKEISLKLSRLKTSAKDQLDVASKMKQKLEEKHSFLIEKQTELDDARYEEHVRMLIEEANKASKKKKTKKTTKVKFIPPVIQDEDEQPDEALMDIYSNDNVADDVTKDGAEISEYEKQEDTIVYVADQMPEFPTGMESFQKYIEDNLKYPGSAKEDGIQGKVYLKFVVASNGAIVNIQLLRGIAGCKECDMEAVRLISQMPKWKPAKKNGKPIACYFTTPVSFKLNQ